MISKVTPPHKAETDVMDTVNIALGFNNNYCQVAAATIASVIKHSTPKYNYQIYIISNDLSEYNKYFINQINSKNNISFRFIDFNIENATKHRLYERLHVSKETYIRLFLHHIIQDVERLLYLDSDIIVTSDMAELYNLDIGNCPIAAALIHSVQENGIEGLKRDNWLHMVEQFSKYENLYNYLTEYLHFSKEDLAKHFNPGLLLMDLKKAGKIIDEGLPAIINKAFLQQDMDILNILFKDNVFILENRYGIIPRDLFDFVHEHGHLPDVIHYIGRVKPNMSMTQRWKGAEIEYWKTISQTDFYYPVLEGFIDNKLASYKNSQSMGLEQIKGLLNDPKIIENLFHSLKRIKRLNMRRKFIRMIIKMLVDGKKYKKLKQNPEQFFEDSKSSFLRYLKKFYF